MVFLFTLTKAFAANLTIVKIIVVCMYIYIYICEDQCNITQQNQNILH